MQPFIWLYAINKSNVHANTNKNICFINKRLDFKPSDTCECTGIKQEEYFFLVLHEIYFLCMQNISFLRPWLLRQRSTSLPSHSYGRLPTVGKLTSLSHFTLRLKPRKMRSPFHLLRRFKSRHPNKKGNKKQ